MICNSVQGAHYEPVLACIVAAYSQVPHSEVRVQTGKDALGDWTTDAPGVRRKVTLNELASPYDTPSVKNHPKIVSRPAGALPKAPAGFVVSEYATTFDQPRVIVKAPNGDLFVSESHSNRVRVLRDADGDGKPELN